MEDRVRKIALIGPESSGKTTLCSRLAAHFHTEWVPEFSREYIGSLQREYTLEDIEHCAREQLASEKRKLSTAHKYLFCDSELIIAKVWCEDVFKKVPSWLEEKIQEHRYDLFLLVRSDIPFRKDDVRENPDRREFFFEWYKRELEMKNFTYEIVGGIGEERFLNSLAVIQKHFRL